MSRAPTFNDIFAAMSAASVGDTAARVALPDDPQVEDLATKFAIALNLLLDDLALRTAELEAAHNVTRVELERLVGERTADLQQANREIEAFSYSVSHDLRAPLRSIDGFSQAVLEDHADKLPVKGKDYLQRIRDSAQRMGELIDDLLALSRVSRAELRRGRVDLSALARVVITDLSRVEPERRVEVVVQEHVVCHADARLLRVALENLLGNSWKFTRKTPAPRVELGTTEDAGQVAYYIRDNGAGFDMAYIGRLFGAFQRLHTEREFPGTGIGLATVQRIIHRHGGRIWAEAAVGKGATFTFTLPDQPGRGDKAT